MTADDEQTHEFRGKSEDDVRSQFTKWLREKAGEIYDVKYDQIVLLSEAERLPKNQYGKLEAVEKFSMLVRYKIGKPSQRSQK
jgi:hypothetical protein